MADKLSTFYGENNPNRSVFGYYAYRATKYHYDYELSTGAIVCSLWCRIWRV